MANNYPESIKEVTDDAGCVVHNRPDSNLAGVVGCEHRVEGSGENEGFYYCSGPAKTGDFNKCIAMRAAGGYERFLPPISRPKS